MIVLRGCSLQWAAHADAMPAAGPAAAAGPGAAAGRLRDRMDNAAPSSPPPRTRPGPPVPPLSPFLSPRPAASLPSAAAAPRCGLPTPSPPPQPCQRCTDPCEGPSGSPQTSAPTCVLQAPRLLQPCLPGQNQIPQCKQGKVPGVHALLGRVYVPCAKIAQFSGEPMLDVRALISHLFAAVLIC